MSASREDVHVACLRFMPELIGAGQAQRQRVTRKIIDALWPHIHSWAPKMCRTNGDTHLSYLDDVVSVISIKIMEKIAEVSASDSVPIIKDWYAYLYSISRHGVLAYFNSSAITAVSGMTTAMRRRRHVETVRAQLRSALGREPSDDEIIEAANADMQARRSNAAKQGALVTHADLQDSSHSTDLDTLVSVGQSDSHDDDALLHPLEARRLTHWIVDTCAQKDVMLGDVAYLWLGRMYDRPPVMGDPSEIAEYLSITKPQTKKLMAEAGQIAQSICYERLGITVAGLVA